MSRCEQCGKSIEGFHVVLAYETGSKQFCDHKCADLYAGSRERSGEPPAGSKRDLKADLKFCDRATQGPWRHEWNPDCSEVYAPGFDNPIILVGHDPYDADFIVQAREGWPHAIERAMKAEALARELVEALDNHTLFSPEKRTMAEWDECEKRLEEVYLRTKEVLGDER